MAEGMAGFHNKSVLGKASPKTNRKLDNSNPLAQPPKCPQCSSTRLYRDGLRYLTDGTTTQRWLCRNCGYRFSQKKPLQKNPDWQINTRSTLPSTCQVCDEPKTQAYFAHTKGMKSLAEVETRKEKAAGATTTQRNLQGKIIEFLWYIRKMGRSEATIKLYARELRHASMHINILAPEQVKRFIAEKKVNKTTKCNLTYTFKTFYNFHKIAWEPPQYKAEKKIPFIPTEEELNTLIANSSKTVGAFLQLLKETGMRGGEALQLEWQDIASKGE